LILRDAGERMRSDMPHLLCHSLVGAAYVHGIMDGEVTKHGPKFDKTVFLV